MTKLAKEMTDEELETLLIFVNTTKSNRRNRAIILLTHLAGLTVGEVADLKFSNVIDTSGNILSESIIKSKNTTRSVLYSEKMQAELKSYLQSIVITDYTLPLFPTQRNEGFTASSLAQIINAIYKKAGFNDCTSHSGRRSFLSKLSNQGVSTEVLMKLAGHKNRSTTLQYAVKSKSDDVLRNAVELLK